MISEHAVLLQEEVSDLRQVLAHREGWGGFSRLIPMAFLVCKCGCILTDQLNSNNYATRESSAVCADLVMESRKVEVG